MEEIDLKELVSIFWEKKIRIIFIVLIFAIVGYVYGSQIKTPMYSSSTTLVLTKTQQEDPTAASITTTDITLNSKLVATYSEIIKSDTTVRDVINNLGLNLSEGAVKKNIKVTDVEDAEVIKITVSNEDSVVASRIANELADVFIKKTKEIYKIDNVHVLDVAETSKTPSNINYIKDSALFAAIGLVISFAYVFVLNMLDNTVKSQEELEKHLKVPVIATIPNYEPDKKGGKM